MRASATSLTTARLMQQLLRRVAKVLVWLTAALCVLVCAVLLIGLARWLTTFSDKVTLPNGMALQREFNFSRMARDEKFTSDMAARNSHAALRAFASRAATCGFGFSSIRRAYAERGRAGINGDFVNGTRRQRQAVRLQPRQRLAGAERVGFGSARRTAPGTR